MKRVFTILSATLLFLSFTNASQAQIFVKIVDGSNNQIDGESLDAKHSKEINATTFGQENTGCPATPPVGSGGGSSCGGTAASSSKPISIPTPIPSPAPPITV